MIKKKLISIITPVFNEYSNIIDCRDSVKNFFKDYKKYNYEHIFVDNNSNDESKKLLIQLAKFDKKVKLLFNKKNYNVLPSLFNALKYVKGNGIITCYSGDLQDDIKILKLFISKWEKGYDLISAQRNKRNEGLIWSTVKKIYYILYVALNNSYKIRKRKHYYVNVFQFADMSVIKKILNKYPAIYPHLPSMLYLESTKIYSCKNIRWLERKKERSYNTFWNYITEACLTYFCFTSLFKIIFSISFFALSIFIYFIFTNYFMILSLIVLFSFLLIFYLIKQIINKKFNNKNYKINKKVNL